MSKVVHEKLSEFDLSRLAEKGVFEVGFSADFVESLQSFIKDNAKLTEEGFTDEHSQNLKKFGQRISGITRKQLDVCFFPLHCFLLSFGHCTHYYGCLSDLLG